MSEKSTSCVARPCSFAEARATHRVGILYDAAFLSPPCDVLSQEGRRMIATALSHQAPFTACNGFGEATLEAGLAENERGARIRSYVRGSFLRLKSEV